MASPAARDFHREQDDARGLARLWYFRCEATSDRTVACVSWNKGAPDVLAVGYGESESRDMDVSGEGGKEKETRSGLVAFWSLKNPEHPEWTFSTPSAVTAMDFSPTEFNVLAVGLKDGTVSVYDARGGSAKRGGGRDSHEPFLKSGDGVPGKHADPVRELRWVGTNSAGGAGAGAGGDRDEVLVSISTDGRVTQWKLKKNLEFSDLMLLTRVRRKPTASTASGEASVVPEAMVSRRAGGTCFDFSNADATTYVAGTEEGMVHKCSSAHGEQYLRNYFGHTGPVHQTRWSPFAGDAFASCSADWTVKLWTESSETPVLTLRSRSADVTDVCWSQTNATVLASSSLDGGLDVWDLAVSTLRPVLSADVAGGGATCVAFSEASPVLAAGGKGGYVGIYRLFGLRGGAKDEVRRLRAALGGERS